MTFALIICHSRIRSIRVGYFKTQNKAQTGGEIHMSGDNWIDISKGDGAIVISVLTIWGILIFGVAGALAL